MLPSTSTLTEASPGELEDLGDAIEAAGVPAIFTESLGTSTDAEALADRLGVDVVELYSDALGEPGSGADTYDGLLRADAAAIAAALPPPALPGVSTRTPADDLADRSVGVVGRAVPRQPGHGQRAAGPSC